MTPKTWIVIAFLVITALRLALQLLHYRSAKNPIPANVADVYDSETYLKWQRYHGELSRLSLLQTLTGAAVTTALLLTDAYSAVAALFGGGWFSLVLAIVLFDLLVETLLGLPFSYIGTMRIEEKYGFNRSSKATFIKDQIIGFIMGAFISSLITCLIYFSHAWFGNWMVVVFAVAMCAFVLALNLISPLLMRLQNKFTPLEEGSLRDKLTDLLTRHGYTVKAIEVMDASRRTTKSNAFFSGFGKNKRVVLFDTLLDNMSEDEICAVFAHELGHGLHHDIPKLLCLNCVNMIATAVLAWLSILLTPIYPAFGFEDLNYGFAYIVLGTVLLPLVMQLLGLFTNVIQRRAEYAADAQAVTEGYGEALIAGLKKLSRENFAHLSPDRLTVVLEYSHPPLSERIAAIERLSNQK